MKQKQQPKKSAVAKQKKRIAPAATSKIVIPNHVKFKLETWRDIGDTEVTGFFISKKGQPLIVEDAVLVRAVCSSVTVDIDSKSISDLYLDQMANDVYPDQLLVWWHTHPGSSANPSFEDMNTFQELGADRSCNPMFILAKGGESFAQISIKDQASGIIIDKTLRVEYKNCPWEHPISYKELFDQYNAYVETEDHYTATTHGYEINKPGTNKKDFGNAVKFIPEDYIYDYYKNCTGNEDCVEYKDGIEYEAGSEMDIASEEILDVIQNGNLEEAMLLELDFVKFFGITHYEYLELIGDVEGLRLRCEFKTAS